MLRDRIKAAAILLPSALAILYFGGILLKITALLLLFILCVEYFTAAFSLPRNQIFLLATVMLLLPISYELFGVMGLLQAVIFLLLLFGTLSVLMAENDLALGREPNAQYFNRFVLGLLYVGMLGTVPYMLSGRACAGKLIAWVLVLVVCSDTFAYFGGRSIGGKKLAPYASPNKTVSGALCGLFTAVLAGCLYGYYSGFHASGALIFFASVLLALLAQVGDLVESLVKRSLGVKDMGSLIPGHGGFLDRVDALIFALPVLLWLDIC